MSMPIIDTVTPISPGELERRTFSVDISDEEGQRYRYTVPRLVAKLLQERADKIACQGAAMDRAGFLLKPIANGSVAADAGIALHAIKAAVEALAEGHNQGGV